MDSWIFLFFNSKFICLLIVLGTDSLGMPYFFLIFLFQYKLFINHIFDMDSWVNLDYYIFMKSNGINSSLFRLT